MDTEFPVHVMDWHHQLGSRPRHHLHGSLEIAWCRSGHGTFLIESTPEAFRSGDVFVIGGAVAHAAHAFTGSSSDWTFAFIDATALLGGWCEPALLESAASARARSREDESMGRATAILVDEFRRRRSCWKDVVRACVLEILVGAHRLCPTRLRTRRSLAKIRALEPALAWIARSYAAPLTVGELARRCRMSASHLRRLFAAQFGCSPLDYLMRHRIQVAAGLLISSDRTIAAIASEVGFSSMSSFYRQFSRRHGMAARAWRAVATRSS